ncbi:sce7726 family protein [Edaphobacter modestus]
MDRLHPDKTDTLVVEELGLCQGIARVDLAVVNGTIHGYEIKSELDTLVRLKSQAEIYSKTLEFVTIVAASSHIPGIENTVPPWWGIWSAIQIGQEVRLKESRKAKRNPSLAPEALVQLLWREEALQILLEHKLARGVASKSRQHIWDRLCASFSVEELGDLVRTSLKQRPSSWRGQSSQA